MYLIIDNYDSFTYNIYQFMTEITNSEIKVIRNDEITVDQIREMNPEGIIISPGPGRPEDGGISLEAVSVFAGKIPILGVCLGHQIISQAFGGEIVQASRIVHGKVENMKHDGRGVFRNIPSPSLFTRYHSLALKKETLPQGFEISAYAEDGEIMGIRHTGMVIEGVQFHPESIASEMGKRLLGNFLNYRREPFPFRDKLNGLIRGENLTQEEAEMFMNELTEGNLSGPRIAAVLTALNAKGIVPEEIAGCTRILHQKRTPLNISIPVLDTCGTGGDGLGTFNISSLSALIASAAGAKVAKHGNRAVSSISGSADFYRELGIKIDISPEKAVECIEEEGFAFLFAPLYHGAMRHAGPVRKDLGIKTIMNLLGPLANPAGASYQIIGVFAPEFCSIVAKAAHLLGLKRVLTVHGEDGEDEISVCAPTKMVEIREDGELKETRFTPESVGITPYPVEDLIGGSSAENVQLAREILDGGGRPAIRDAVCVNAGAALYVSGICDSIKDGYETAREVLADGSVKDKVEKVIVLSNQETTSGISKGSGGPASAGNSSGLLDTAVRVKK